MPEGYFMTCTDLEKECMILLTYYTGVEYLLNSLSILQYDKNSVTVVKN